MADFQMADYVDVAERIRLFREAHPTGSLQPADPLNPYSILLAGDQTFVVVVAAAYRDPDDPRPGIGMAQELIPGKTPYTRGSELQNAETSAWGRAIVAALAADTKRGVASADEVRNRAAEQETVTDPATLSSLNTRITVAQDEATLRLIYTDVTEHNLSGEIADEDRALLVKAISVRKEEL